SLGILLGAAAGGVYLLVTPPSFTAEAKIIIATEKAHFIQQQAMFTDGPLDTAQMESQLQILQSSAIAASVVEQLKLADDPDFVQPHKLNSLLGLLRRIPATLAPEIFTAQPSSTRAVDRTQIATAAVLSGVTVRRIGFSHAIEISFSCDNRERSAQIANAIA